MKIIEELQPLVGQTLGKQKLKENTNYRRLTYIRQVDADEGKLLFNLLTGEMLLLSREEMDVFYNCKNIDNELAKTLIEKWFLVPEDTDDAKLSQQFVFLVNSINNIYSAPKINSFTILPTTDCNARCFYCFEHGCKKKWMSEQTALDVVDYIMKKKTDGEIKLRWFGGEPLYNSKVIDIICTELKKRGVEYHSHMVSNGYLFDEEMVERANNLWHLKKIQITLDGTEKIYNRIKAYIYKDVSSPFKRVIGNIEALLKKNIDVSIRLNMDKYNVDDLFTLTDDLLEQMGKYDGLYIYPHLLYENSCKFKQNDAEKDDKYLNDRYLELKAKVTKKINKQSKYNRIMRFKNHCLADTDTSVMILPEGELGKCEHFIDDHFIGSIYNDEIDYKNLNWFKQMTTVMPECDECEMRPACIYVACCPSRSKRCTPADKQTKITNLDAHIKYVYDVKRSHKNET